MKKIRELIRQDIQLSVLVGITFLIIVWSILQFGTVMYSTKNIQAMMFQIPEFGFLALAMMLSNMIGGIDLSIIANANTVAIFTAYILNGQWFSGINGGSRIVVAILFAFLCSIVFGMINGLLISKTSAPPLIATLGTMTLFQGIGMAMTGGSSVGGIEEGFAYFGKATILQIPIIFIIFFVVVIGIHVFMSYSRVGRNIYLYGANPVATRFSALSNEKICMTVFLLTAILAGIAGLIILSRVNSAKIGYGESYLLQTLIVCVIGGIDPNGGKGKVIGVFLAVIIMQIMSNGFTILALSPYAKKLIWGVVLLLVLGLNYIFKKYLYRLNSK